MSQDPNASELPPALRSAASKLFDIRIMIGGLFVLYGLMLTIAGFFTNAAELAKAAGININLWLGLGMLVLGILFLVWEKFDPLHIEPNPTGLEPEDQPGFQAEPRHRKGHA